MIARKSLLILSSTFILQIINAVQFIILIKFWGDFAPTAIGSIGLAMSFIALFNIVSDLGFNQAHIKRISEGKDLGTCIGTFATIKIILTIIMVLITIISFFIIKNILGLEIYDPNTESIIFIFLIVNVFANLSSIPFVTFTGKKEMVKREFPYIFGVGIGFPFTILVITAGVSAAKISPAFIWPGFLRPIQQFISENALKSLALTYVVVWLIILFSYYWFFRRYPIKKPNRFYFKSYLTFALPMMFLPIITIIIKNADRLIIGYYWSTIEVGYYFSMTALISVILVFSNSINAVLFPSISEFCSNEMFIRVKGLINLAERYISMVSIFLIVIVVLLAKPIILIIMSDVFLGAAPILTILAIYAFFYSINTPYNCLLIGMDKPVILTKITIVTCIITIILSLLFVPKNGLLSIFDINGASGAAMAITISAIVAFFALRFVTKKLTDIKLWQNYTFRHVFAGLIVGIILYYLSLYNLFLPFIHLYQIIIFILIGLAIYVGVLVLLKEFDKDDLHFFLDCLNPKKMLKYISSELKDETNEFNKK